MKFGPLTILGHKPMPGYLSLAYWHSPHSLTWRWTLTLGWRNNWRCGFYGGKHNCGGQWSLYGPLLHLQFSVQHPMWYRDLHRADNDNRERESYERYLTRSAASRVSQIHSDHSTIQ